MKAGLAISSVAHILTGLLLFVLAGLYAVPTPPEPPHVDIELEHGEGHRSNPGSSPEDPPGGATLGDQSAVPPHTPSPPPGQSAIRDDATTQNDQPAKHPDKPPTDAIDAAPLVPEPLPVHPDVEPVAPEKAGPQPKLKPVQLPVKPVSPPQTPPARRAELPAPRPPQPAPADTPPVPPQPKTELVVRLGDGVGQSVLRDGTRPSQPEATNGLPPYPAYAQSRGMQGEVVLRMQVGSNGTVLSAEIVQSSGYPLLDLTAQSWVVKTYRFKPALLDEKPVADTREQRFIFVLEVH